MIKKEITKEAKELQHKLDTAAQEAVKVIAESAEKAAGNIATAAESATKLLASSAQSATKLLASNATEALRVSNTKHDDDHDILVVLKSKMDDLKSDIKDLKDNTTKRVDTLESTKLNTQDSYAVLYKKDVDASKLDHENRIRANETSITKIMTYGSGGILLLGIIEFLILKFWH